MSAPADPRQRCEVVEGDITRLAVDAIVNAANRALEPGGGVCGAIHRAAGPELARACRAVAPCPTGEARLTPGFRLPARHVIHAVGPVWQGGGAGEEAALAACYRNSLKLAAEHDLASIAFPAISTGIYGFPAERATAIAVATVAEVLAATPSIERVVFACFDAATAARYRAALAR
ncbi:MAG: O-acetyl-ADP-ribose deacetylase [Dongiaceae bacterium]